ncbi:MAG TPA: response regulator [Rhodanobacteraceae bacterium]|nr:response regulator [Rhodanobacteraceae bacterium]
MARAAPPHILLAEDDPVSRVFLTETLRQLGCSVLPVADGAEALDAARSERFDLLVLDRSLPRMAGDQVLLVLREDATAASRDAPAIAATADPEAAIHAQLRAAGFAGVLVKPLDATSLRKALAGFGLPAGTAATGVLDDDAGLAASGNAATLAALRGLFAVELQTLQGEFEGLRLDHDALRGRLHRLRAACGFCGAMALQHASVDLSDALQAAEQEHIVECGVAFRRTLATTLRALRQNAAG